MHPNVEGYGVVSEGETYHPSAFFDPAQKFAKAGEVPPVEDQDKAPEGEEFRPTVNDGPGSVETPGGVTTPVPSNPSEITAEQSNADIATSRVHPDVPNVDVEFTAQPSVVVTKVENGEAVETTPVTNVVGVDPNGEAPEVAKPNAADPSNLLSDKSAQEIEDAITAKQLEDQDALEDAEPLEDEPVSEPEPESESNGDDNDGNDGKVQFS